MISIELERLGSPVVGAILVRQKVGVRYHLRNNGPVLEDLPLDILLLNGNAKVSQLVDLIVDPALIGLKMIDIALLLLAGVGHALLGNESLLAAPVEDLVDVAAIAAILTRIAVNHFLW